MIKFSISDFNIYENVDLLDNYLLIIENKQYLYSFLNDMVSDSTLKEYIKLFDENEKQLKTVDYVDFVPSIVHIDINNKKNINALIRFLKKDCIDSLKKYSADINKLLDDAYNTLKLESPIDIISDIKFSEDEIMKILNISINDNSNTLLDRISTYIKISFELRKIKIFVFYNLLAYLEEKEIEDLIRTHNYDGISIINIENHNINIDCFTNKKVLDNDICLLSTNLV